MSDIFKSWEDHPLYEKFETYINKKYNDNVLIANDILSNGYRVEFELLEFHRQVFEEMLEEVEFLCCEIPLSMDKKIDKAKIEENKRCIDRFKSIIQSKLEDDEK